jgi:hypothetical protein
LNLPAEKTSQALREKPDEDHQPVCIGPGPLGVLIPGAPMGFLAGTTATVMGNLLAASADESTKTMAATAEAPMDAGASQPLFDSVAKDNQQDSGDTPLGLSNVEPAEASAHHAVEVDGEGAIVEAEV